MRGQLIVSSIAIALGIVLVVIGAHEGGDLARRGGPFALGAILIVGAVIALARSQRSS
jgi:hypothetical protein